MIADLESNAKLGPFREWRAELAVASGQEQRFGEWVFLNAATVLIGEKTGELLALDLDELGLTTAEVESGLERLAGQWGFEYRLLIESNGFLKLIIFQKERLQSVLDEVPFCVMGAKLNYGYPLRAEAFVEEVKGRWMTHGTIPHEIGVALGYPLDDVFGFMGLLPLACKGACGWQVYGCMEESQRRSCAFNTARCQALAFLAGTAAACCSQE